MKSFNSVTLVGRLTKKPASKETSKGGKRVSYTLAVNRPYSDNEGNHPTDFFPIITWNKLGEICDNYLDKGSLVLVKGRLQSRSYTSNKQTKWITEIMAESVNILEYKPSKKIAETETVPA